MKDTTKAAIHIARLVVRAADNGTTRDLMSPLVEMLSCGGYDDPDARFEEVLSEAEACAEKR